MAGSLVATTADESESSTTTTIRDEWKVQYAHFFNYPNLPCTHPSLAAPPSTRIDRSTGTWISLSSSSTASLNLLTDLSASAESTILTVTFGHRTLEEHYISKLHFTWPQVSCITARGSRTVLSSYKNNVGQIQKFALRFSALHETEDFTSSLKEIFDGAKVGRIPRGSLGSELSSQSEFVPSNRPPYSTYENLNHLSSACTSADQMPLSLDYEVQSLCQETPMTSACTSASQIPESLYYEVSLNSISIETPLTSSDQMPPSLDCKVSLDSNSREPIINCEMDAIFPAFPPSFTSLLTNCCATTEKAPAQATASELEKIDLKSQIMRYLEDSSFQDMLSKVQKIITEMGYDLLLYDM